MKPYDVQLTVLQDGQQKTVRLYPVFSYKTSECTLLHLLIFSDGMIVCDSQSLNLDGLRSLMKQGVIRTTLSDNESLYIPELVGLTATEVMQIVEEEEFMKEVEDIFKELNGLPTTSDHCRKAYQEYLKDPTEEGRCYLKETYERVPKHLDCWLLGFPEKDAPIRAIIYGEGE